VNVATNVDVSSYLMVHITYIRETCLTNWYDLYIRLQKTLKAGQGGAAVTSALHFVLVVFVDQSVY